MALSNLEKPNALNLKSNSITCNDKITGKSITGDTIDCNDKITGDVVLASGGEMQISTVASNYRLNIVKNSDQSASV